MNRFSLELDCHQSAAAQDRNNNRPGDQRASEMRCARVRIGRSNHTL